MTSLTWETLLAIDPGLDDVLAIARTVKDDKSKWSFCQREVWNSEIRHRLMQLVSWQCERYNTILRTCLAFDVALREIRKVLPPCRRCECYRYHNNNNYLWHVHGNFVRAKKRVKIGKV